MKFDDVVQNNASVGSSSGITSVTLQPVVLARPAARRLFHTQQHVSYTTASSTSAPARPSRYAGKHSKLVHHSTSVRHGTQGNNTAQPQHHVHHSTTSTTSTTALPATTAQLHVHHSTSVTVHRETQQARPPQHVRHGTQGNNTAQPQHHQHHVHQSTSVTVRRETQQARPTQHVRHGTPGNTTVSSTAPPVTTSTHSTTSKHRPPQHVRHGTQGNTSAQPQHHQHYVHHSATSTATVPNEPE